jgi:RNA polymerase sigma-70 factor, ECF subfamily
MERYATGDGAAFAEVYENLGPRLFAFLRRRCGSVERAEDLVQQTFLQMHRGRASFLPGAEVTPWAFAIARRLCIDMSRKEKRQVPFASEEEVEMSPPASRDPRADEVVHARELVERVERELERLPEAQRVAFELVKQDGFSIAEAAQILGTTQTAVKLRAHRAYEALRAVLGSALEREKPL